LTGENQTRSVPGGLDPATTASAEIARLRRLLQPFTGDDLPIACASQLGQYLVLLLRWNARVNLTAVRDPEQIITRHFGESLFASRTLFGCRTAAAVSVADVGSGAGFPGLPIKISAPQNTLTLIESQNKKATFLREVVRALSLQDAEVFSGRAEQWKHKADVVTLRAVEKFESVLPIAAGLVADEGRLCLLIGSKQLSKAQKILAPSWTWRDTVPIPLSEERVIAIAERSKPVT
jgi:16S rRNA (guanine527-N7)-methyltransferase